MSRFSFFNFKKRRLTEIHPDEILLDSSNLPRFDTHQLEGRLEKVISKTTLFTIGSIACIILAIFLGQAWKLQILNGEAYRTRSENNILRPVPIFAGRGIVYDRNGIPLAWNTPPPPSSSTTSINSLVGGILHRTYATTSGLAHVLGYIQYPSKDANGFYYREDFTGVDGIEKYFDDLLQGSNGSRLIEVDARGKALSTNTIRPAVSGKSLDLSIDSRVQSALYNNIRDIAERVGFAGGAGVMMDVETGEIIALTSYPEFNPQTMSDASNPTLIGSMLSDERLLFLDRAIDGLYVPGSIVKPYIALGVLNERIIDPVQKIKNSGSISIPNPYDPKKETVFRDWKDLGSVDLRRAIAYSSDVYFYIVSGGYENQKGLGIAHIDKYMSMFGFGSGIPDSFTSSKTGTIPTPEWKKKTFNEDWYLGNTYHTAIGQYGTQVTPIQVVRAVAAVANKGTLLVPTILKDASPEIERAIDIPREYFDIVHEGMRMSVREGTSVALNVPYTSVAGKSGTAELGITKERVNSWMTGFWPYERPRYAFAVILEKGSVHNLIGAAAVMRQQLDWMHIHTPEYFTRTSL